MAPTVTRTAARWLVFLLVPLSLWPLLAWLHGAPRVDGALALRDARFVAASTAEPPAADAAGELRTLPDDWRRAPRGILAGWYELRFSVERSNADEWAIYLPALSMNAAIYLDRELVGDGGRFDEPVARNWSRPLLWPLAGTVFAPGEHVLHVRLQADLPDSGLLDRVYVGPLDVLAPAYARRDALKVEAVWVITLCLAIVGVFTGALWLQWRDPSYGWFAAAAFAWAAIHLNLLVVDIPVGTVTWWGCWYLALIAWVIALARFLLAFIGSADPRPVRGLTILGLAGVAVLVPLTMWQSPWLHPAARVWITASLPVLGLAVVKTMQWLREQGDDPGAAVPSVLGLSVVGCAVHDWLIFLDLAGPLGLAGPTYDYFLPYAAPSVFVAMGWVLLRRFTDALEESAALVADLERRVDAERDELQRNYERLHDVERARVLAEERERIMREMHDGLGSHLVSTLALLETDGLAHDAVGHAVRAALDDLRLMIDALVPLDGDLLGALAMLRARMQPRLEAAGIRVVWRISDLPRIADLGASQVLQVLRILQEAVTNVLKHAGARTITVRTSDAAGADRGVMVEIADDGCGLVAATPAGRGLQNMRQRAAAIGATLEIEGVPPGTRIRLHIPIAERAVA
jgi:signal transduction histidine kinase